MEKIKTNDYVYDVSLDGTVVNALGLNVMSNTDGFNFELPKEYRYTKENPYISTGESRETTKDKEYVGFAADVAEFNDKYMKDFHYTENAVNKMGLGIDEVVDATINFARKNYADYFPDKEFPEDVKLVGNTIKSKKMPEYIKLFLEKGVRLLLNFQGQKFIEEYYSYINKIWNYQIPLKQIASKGKIKKSKEEYIEDCKTITKAGRPKSRQAWMELVIKNNIDVHLGETVYYINTGTSKSQADVKKVTSYYKKDENGNLVDAKKEINSRLKDFKKENGSKISMKNFIEKYCPDILVKEDIVLNCEMVPREIVESENDYFCEEGKEYNVQKYIDQFNKRITPLLVCFSKNIRDKILIKDPSERPYFTEDECILTNGEPNKPGDQDTYEALMTMDDKEIVFWLSHPEWTIPFLKECNMDWEAIVKDFKERKEKEKKLGIDITRSKFEEALNNMSMEEFKGLIEDGTIPKEISEITDIDPVTGNFVDKTYPDIVIATINDVIYQMETNDFESFEE